MRVFSLSRLAPRERYVIGLFRGADPTATTGELPALFHQLRLAGSAIGFRPAPIGCVYVTGHELCLLGIIAGLQRDNPGMAITISKAVRPVALACARRLAHDGVYLTHATLARLAGLTEMCEELSVSISPVTNLPLKRTRSPYFPSPESLQAKALGFVRARGHTSLGDLAGFGVSRQVVSLMFKRGLLVRVRTGVYQAAPETLRE
ncbi:MULTISPECIES: hypothetical protein [Pseudomonadota]|jgi:hypothetical protein|uniref:hypothetical protein n=1 Tax=Pseudomonadota TaxID=1224 RepID=UPI00076ACA3A|nr:MULTISPECIES: hypothetical protein [Pseudomonadota]MAF63411.1 hypothetical protein [Blastomonas sp.]MDM7957872.1 hypothetical protein [Blastomonas sp.]|tara:strand:+ start:181 stop:795 length:615 start_codon:yes stop_codon:yes gene_type:complete